MALLDSLTSLFSSQHRKHYKAFKELRAKLKQHEVIQYYHEETAATLLKFSKQRRHAPKNIGMVIRGTMNIGKTQLVTKILNTYFLATDLISQNVVYKIHSYGVSLQRPVLKTLVDFRNGRFSFEQVFNDIKPGSIIIVDNPHLRSPYSPSLMSEIKLLLAAEKHAKTLVILCASFKKLEKIRAKFDIDTQFPPEFEIKIELSLDQTSELFVRYAAAKGFKIAPGTVPTLKYYFSIRHQNSRLSNILIGENKLDRSYYTYFAYKTEFENLLTSITEQKLPEQIDIPTIRHSEIFIESSNFNQKLKSYL